MTTSAPTPIGTPIVMGGSDGTVTGTGTTYRRGVPTPVLFVKVADFSDGTIKLTGSETYAVYAAADLAEM